MPLLLLKYSDAMAPEARDAQFAGRLSRGVEPDTEKMYQFIVEVFTWKRRNSFQYLRLF
jgi:hypothetical protein